MVRFTTDPCGPSPIIAILTLSIATLAVDKAQPLKGYYIQPDLYGAAEEKQIEWARHPEMMKQMQEHRRQAKQKQPRLTAAARR
jgi:hypothetical protein